jgi:hypothetical protein
MPSLPQTTKYAASRPLLPACLTLTIAAVLLTASVSRAQTVVAGYEVETWAAVLDPVDLTAAPDGSLYVGRDLTGSGGIADAPASIHRIAPDGSVAPFGPQIDDPDAVLFDAAGNVGPAGSVLVGGSVATGGAPLESLITAIDEQQGVTVLFGPSSSILNPSGLAIEASGDLLVTDFNLGKVFRLTNLVPTEVVANGSSPLDVAIDPGTGQFAVSFGDALIRLFAPDGTELDGNVGSGRALAFDPFTSPSDLWTVDNTTGELLRIAADGTTTVMGQGFSSVYGMDFDAAGHLFLSEFDEDRVLRVQVDRPDEPWDDLGQAMAGTHGEPVSVGTGTLVGGDPVGLTLSNALENAPAWLVVGVAELSSPFKGGVLVPDPTPPGFFVALPTDATGTIALAGAWPLGVPSGFVTWFQWWITDAAGPKGFASSNGLSATAP